MLLYTTDVINEWVVTWNMTLVQVLWTAGSVGT